MNETRDRTFGEALYALRIAKGKTKEELAKKSGLRATEITLFEAGAFVPSIRDFALIAENLNLTDAEVVSVINTLKPR